MKILLNELRTRVHFEHGFFVHTDKLGKLTKVIDNCSDVVYNYRYNELGNIVEEKRNGGIFKSFEYDRHNRLSETTVSRLCIRKQLQESP